MTKKNLSSEFKILAASLALGAGLFAYLRHSIVHAAPATVVAAVTDKDPRSSLDEVEPLLDTLVSAKWLDLRQRATVQFQTPGAFAAYQDVLMGFYARRNLPLEDKMMLVDAWVDTHIAYEAEPAGQDVWQTPLETLKKGRGDCEDQAILKFYVLTAFMNVPENRCFLVSVDTTKGLVGFDHMVMGVAPGTGALRPGVLPDMLYLNNNDPGALSSAESVQSVAKIRYLLNPHTGIQRLRR